MLNLMLNACSICDSCTSCYIAWGQLIPDTLIDTNKQWSFVTGNYSFQVQVQGFNFYIAQSSLHFVLQLL